MVFVRLSLDTEVVYKVTNYYSAKYDLGIRPERSANRYRLARWTEQRAQLSEKDKALLFLKTPKSFRWGKVWGCLRGQVENF